MNLYAIKDSALGAFTNIMQFPSDGVAIRAFSNEANRRESEINQHPKDYDLFAIGTFDDRTGVLHNTNTLDTPLIRAVQVIESE